LTIALLGGLILGMQTASPGASGAAPATNKAGSTVLLTDRQALSGAPETAAGLDGQDEKPDKTESGESPGTTGTDAIGVVTGRAASGAATGSAATLPNTLNFSGHAWMVKSSAGTVGPGPNRYSAKNAAVDTSGNLHLRISKEKGRWYSSEIINTASLGYGTYRWTATTDLSNLDRNVVLGLFTWNDLPDYANREIDIEVARWGSTTDPTNAQFVVQPYGSPGHLQRFIQTAGGPSTLEFTWSPGRIDYLVRQGTGVVDAWSYAAPDVPVPGGETVRMNLWQYQGLAPSNGQPVEVVFSNFDFCTASGVCQ
jgi:hypothetical protein